jgi:MATE family multidrug resistance protein
VSTDAAGVRTQVTATTAETRALLTLAIPLALSNIGNQLLGAVDTAVVGRLGEVALGAVGLGNGIYFTVVVVGLGLMLGIDPLVSQALGANEAGRARGVLVQGAWIALVVSVPLALLMAVALAVLEPLGIAEATSRETAAYVWARMPGLLPFLVMVGARTYLAARAVTWPMVVGMIVANVVNLPVSWALVFGDQGLVDFGLPALGVPALGVAGAGWTSTVCTVIQCAIVLYAVRAIDRVQVPVPRRFDRAVFVRALALGAPIGGALLAEVGIFALTAFFAGLLGSRPLAAHNVAITLASTAFQVPLALGAATSVRVGRAVGRGDAPGARRAGIIGMLSGAAFMGASGLLFLVAPALLSRVITDDADVVAAAVPLVLVAAAFQLVDGVQAVGAGALRGAGDTRFALVANVVGHYAIGLPFALVLTFPLELGARGLWWGLCAGLSVVAVALVARFRRISRQQVARS